MNTRITYRYADKTNCKQFTAIVVEGTITWEQIAPYLARQHSFIPGQIGLEDLQQRFALPGADHPWHQITAEDITPTTAAPTIALSAADLARQFASTTWRPEQARTPKAVDTMSTPTEAHGVAETRDAALHVYARSKPRSSLDESDAPARKKRGV